MNLIYMCKFTHMHDTHRCTVQKAKQDGILGFDCDCLDSVVQYVRNDIFRTLDFSIHPHFMSICLGRFLLISFNSNFKFV